MYLELLHFRHCQSEKNYLHSALQQPAQGSLLSAYCRHIGERSWHAGQLFTLTACFGGEGHLMTVQGNYKNFHL